MNVQADQRFREALTCYRAGDRDAAAALCRRILETHAGHADAGRLLAVMLEEAGRVPEAIRHLEELARAGQADGRILYSLGRLQAKSGSHAEAVETLDRARRTDPDNHQIPLALGYCLARMGRFDEAAGQYEYALQVRPDDPAIFRGYGEILTRLTRFDEAIAAYRKALDLDPRDPVAPERLVGLYERTNRLDDMAEAVAAGLARRPDDPTLRFYRAVYLRRRDDPDAALELLAQLAAEKLPADLDRRVAFESARLLDRLQRYDEAFDRAGHGNRVTRRLARRAAPEAEAYGAWLDRVHRVFSAAWESASADDGPGTADHEPIVFILGFPRSGTTLIDALLDAQGGFQVYEERPFLEELFEELQQRGLAYPECGAGLDPEIIAAMRERYFHAAQRYAERRPGSVIVDKNPLATPAVPLLHQVFPQAKYIFAARHPLDVCLSCYLYPFSPNSALAECADVGQIAEVYAKAVRIWDLARRQLPLSAMELPYESLVADFESESRRLFEFLGIPWDEGVLDFARQGREGAAPTLRNYDRVNQGIYQGSRYRWRHYRKQLEPAVPLVAEAASRLGYDT